MNKLFKLTILLTLAAVILISTVSCVPLAKGGTTDPAKSTVFIQTIYNYDGEYVGYGSGSGFAIGIPGQPVEYIVTNYHVVKDIVEGGKVYTQSGVTVYFSAAGNNFMKAQVYRYNEAKDIAVLKLPEPTTQREALVICKSSSMNLTDDVRALGFPSYSFTADDYSKMDMDDIANTYGNIQKKSTVDEKEVYLLDLNISHGNSGGPLVNSKGEVIAINSFKYDFAGEEASAKYAIIIDELLRIIDREEIPYVLSTEWWNFKEPYIIGGIAVAVIALAIICAIIVSSKGPKPPITFHSEDQENSNSHKKTQASSQAYVKGTAGVHSGKTYTIKGAIKFGRDNSSCTVIFSNDAPGISGTHCMVEYTGNQFRLTDLGSSYGTFLANGTKLTPNTPVILQSGDSFYLANSGNTFEIGVN